MKIQILLKLFSVLVIFISYDSVGQLGRWKLDNNANDATTNAINGTLVGNPLFSTDSKQGSHSLVVDGTTQYIDLGNPQSILTGTSPKTISAWAKTSSVSGLRYIMSFGSNASGKSVNIGLNNTTVVANGSPSNNGPSVTGFWAVGVWHHVCMTYDGTSAKLYADGILISTVGVAWNFAKLKAYIGRGVSGSQYWMGSIDDVRFYNTALTATEVAALAALPVTPSSFAVSAASSSSNQLTWSDQSSSETGFQIERSLTSGTGYAVVNTTAPNATSFTDTGLNFSTTYYYRIRSINDNGNSTYSAEKTITTLPPNPIAPTGLSATAISPIKINLSWTDASNNETGFQLERSTTSASGFLTITTTSPNVTSFSDNGLNPATTYYYRVMATNTGGNSTYTPVTSATTQLLSPPLVPTGLTASAASSSSITLTWTDASDNETGFDIERSLNAASGFSLITTTEANAASYTNISLNESTAYYYRITSKNSAGNSSYTAVATATTPVSAPAAPSAFTATAATSSISLHWQDNSTNETGFVIEKSMYSGTGFTEVSNPAASSVNFVDSDVTPGISYFYRVKAINAGGSSSYSGESTATISIAGVTQVCTGLFCDANGSIGVGTQIIPLGFKMAVKGKVISEGFKVDLQSAWPDYVFHKSYKLMELHELKNFISHHGHLPNVPSAEEVMKDGLDVSEINVKLLEKIEELSLYLIKMEQRVGVLENENAELKSAKVKKTKVN